MKYHAVLYSRAATDPKSGVVNRFLGSISQIPAYFPVGGREGVKIYTGRKNAASGGCGERTGCQMKKGMRMRNE